MQYYQLEYSLDPAEVGTTFPQSHIARQPVRIDDPRYLGRQDTGQSLRRIPLPEPVVHPDAKLSDLLSTVATWRMLMSEKLKSVLEPFIYPAESEFLQVKVHYVSDHFDYWMFNPIHFNMDAINFGASETWLCGIGNLRIEKVNLDSFASYEDYQNLVKLPEHLLISNLVLTDNPGRDFLQLKNVNGIKYYVSENLRQQLVNSRCTGLRFTKLQKITE